MPVVPAAVRPLTVHRAAAGTVLVVLIAVLASARGLGAPTLRVGEPAPEDVLATADVRVVDEAATGLARRAAAESVDAVLVPDPAAQRAIVDDLRAVFAAARDVRQPPTEPVVEGPGEADEAPPPRTPSPAEQRLALAARLPDLPPSTVAALVAASDTELDLIERETIAVGQLVARQRLREDTVATALAETLAVELGLRSLPGDTGERVLAVLLERAARPTVLVDLEATAAARARAAAAVPETVGVWRAGEAVVRAGEVVGPLQAEAIARLDLGGRGRGVRLATGALVGLLSVVTVGLVLARMHPAVWAAPTALWVLTLILGGYAVAALAVGTLAAVLGAGWGYLVPAGALATLVAVTVGPGPALATALPAALIVLLLEPAATGVAVHVVAAVLIAVALTRGITSRADLRAALLRTAVSAPLVVAVLLVLLDRPGEALTALAAAALGGAASAVIVQGALPWIESGFRLPTVTALLDLADRNHPLLRELEQKALGSYNHSVMVASLTERACRAIGADPLLGNVAALYHDIGKVRQPHYFIENQQGIANPHDGLEPRVSALIIMNHVVDGVELATSYRLPPDVVACIGSHHGTMRVKYFYERAVAAAGSADAVDEAEFRYRGTRPRSREAAVLLLADSCEATTRALAMTRGTLPREEIEATVDALLAERLEDGQFDEAAVTLQDLRTVRDTLVASLVGIYHPRIAYPAGGAAGAALEGPANAR